MSELEHPPAEPEAPEVLAVDVGGSHVKMLVNGGSERRRFVSGPDLKPGEMVKGVLDLTSDWEYGAVSVGVPTTASGRVERPQLSQARAGLWVMAQKERRRDEERTEDNPSDPGRARRTQLAPDGRKIFALHRRRQAVISLNTQPVGSTGARGSPGQRSA